MMERVLKCDSVVIVYLCLTVDLVVLPVGQDPVPVPVHLAQPLRALPHCARLLQYFGLLRRLG